MHGYLVITLIKTEPNNTTAPVNSEKYLSVFIKSICVRLGCHAV